MRIPVARTGGHIAGAVRASSRGREKWRWTEREAKRSTEPMAVTTAADKPPAKPGAWYSHLYVQVLIAIAAGSR